jgi:hypothetical protein
MGYVVTGDPGDPLDEVDSRRSRLVILVILVVMVLLIAIIATTYGPWRSTTDDEIFPSSVQVMFVRELSLTTSNGDVEYETEVPVPYDIEGIQDLDSVSYDPQPQRTYTYKNQSYAAWEGELRAGRTITVSITYDVTLTATGWNVDKDTCGSTYDVPPDYGRYLGPEWLISPQEVENRSRGIVDGETDVYTIVHTIYRWMRRNIDYMPGPGGPRSCEEVLADGAGDGDDQAILFASLARAAGVPTWVVFGLRYDPVRDDWRLHMWNNVYIPMEKGGSHIVTVDVAFGRFLFRDPYRLSLWVSNGDGEDLQGIYSPWSYSYSTSGPRPIVSSKEVYRTLTMRTEGGVKK